MTDTVRTDEQILHGEPVMVRLGGVEYPIRPLSIRETRIWKQSLTRQAKEITNRIDALAAEGSPGAFEAFLLDAPDTMYELIFSYSKTLPRDVILDTATDREMVGAFREVMRLAFPLLEIMKELRMVAGVARG